MDLNNEDNYKIYTGCLGTGETDAEPVEYKYVQLVVDITSHAIDKVFTYAIPDELIDKIYVGCPVKVVFGGMKSLRSAYVIDFISEAELDIDKNRIKYIDSVAADELSARTKLISLACWMKEHYGTTMYKALMTVLPVKNKIKAKTFRKVFLKIDKDNIKDCVKELESKKKTAWIRLIKALAENENGLEGGFIRNHLKINLYTLIRMEVEGLIYILEEERSLSLNKTLYGFEEGESDGSKIIHELNIQQKAAVEVFNNDFIKNDFLPEYLLYGITGSGKTEVYIEMIKTVLSKKRQAIVLIPEISLTYQTVRRFVNVFGKRIAIMNSSMSASQRYGQFMLAEKKQADIIIGPRSALFAPFDNIGLIIIDEEHDCAYKNETVPRYDAREVAAKLAKIHNAALVLASATPSVETYKKVLENKIKCLKLTQKAVPGASLSKTHIVDLREELKAGNKSIFSKKLKYMIEEKLSMDEQVMLFMNRRGYSNFVSCRSCGEAIKCKHCDVSLTLHKDGRLRCHYCGYSLAVPDKCPACGSGYIAGFGIGTQQLETITKKMFPQACVLRLDTDTASKKHGAVSIIKDFSEHKADILIGTQMIVKGHDFSNVSLVGIMAADTSLYVGGYNSAEKTFQLLTQAAGRAGRAGQAADVVIQTYRPEHYAVMCAAEQDFERFYKEETAFRKITAYPPMIHILSIQFSSRNEKYVDEFSKYYAECAKKEALKYGAYIIGPAPARIYKVHDFYRKLVYIKHIDYDILLRLKQQLQVYADKHTYAVNVGILYDFE
ncbi:hypothetical protein HMPREF9333_00904 [Johnsonella ignava ATCC 51276]|uniref:Replication restart protein PriA n=1 Tax=Johnsonella ignava ATCC 51276 TaxID=679200 RepID=G5GH64_9FIRM|nr:primosomal protein N' [Johnsonella ignava]EHI55861.1 hypothetical protein HMPREF9333_00904 [Johnsonella ignava ATCC 51276]